MQFIKEYIETRGGVDQLAEEEKRTLAQLHEAKDAFPYGSSMVKNLISDAENTLKHYVSDMEQFLKHPGNSPQEMDIVVFVLSDLKQIFGRYEKALKSLQKKMDSQRRGRK